MDPTLDPAFIHAEFHTLHAESCPEEDWLDCMEPEIDYNCACCEEWERMYDPERYAERFDDLTVADLDADFS